ncbi:hypothetical protein SEUCBS139899_007167 [Sporothrix eucalyptigena]|uniref:Uncharacterized protein n=1 Tax=Sporothrix eucalyptigena TaxID=1812306 RepID=A0ABP0C433_9PEZI
MRYDYPMMMAGSTTIAAPRMDQPTGLPASQSASFLPSSYRTPFPPQSSSSRPQPHRRSSNTSTSTAGGRRHRSTSQQQQQQHYQYQQQPQLLFYPAIVPYQQMPYQHQRMHNLLHGSQYAAPYYHNQGQNQSHGYRPHYLLPHAPPTSQQHSSSSSFSSSQQLSVLQKQQLQAQAQASTQSQALSSKAQMPLFSAFSLRGSNHNKMTTHNGASSSQKLKTGTVGIKPPVRDPKAKADRNRGPVDAKDLSQRLHSVLTQRELQAAARANGSAISLSSGTTMSPVSPLSQATATHIEHQPGPGQMGDRSGRRIRSRGSGNLRALYASNGLMPPSMMTSGSTSSIRRQPFSAPHLGALVPPPSLPELQRRHSRTRSLSPQHVNMRGGGSAGLGPSARDGPTIAPRRAATGVIPPSNAHHGVPYVPSQAAQQFARTTMAVGGARKSILQQKPRQPPYNHNQFETRASPPPMPQQLQKSSKSPSPAGTNATTSIKSPVIPSSATAATGAPAVQHAFKDALSPPGSKRQSLKDGAEAEDTAAEASEANTDGAAAEAVDPEANIDTEVEEARARAAGAKKIVAAAELRRIVHEHSVDWTQSDESSAQRKKEKKGKKEREKREKKAQQQQQQQQQKMQSNGSEVNAAKQARPLWRLKQRLSSFSKDKLSSPPTVSVVAVAEENEDKEAGAAFVTNADDVLPKAQEVEAPSTVEDAKVAPSASETATEAPPAAELTSTSSSVLSLTSLAKSSSFLSRFKH